MMAKVSKQFLENLAANPRFGLMPTSRRQEIGNALVVGETEAQGKTILPSGEVMDTSNLTPQEKDVIKTGGLDEWHRRFCTQLPDKTWVRKTDFKKILSTADEETKTRLTEGEVVWQQKYGKQVGKDWVSQKWYDALSDIDKSEIDSVGLNKFTSNHYVTIGNDSVRKEWYDSLPVADQASLKSMGMVRWQDTNTKKYLSGLPSVPAPLLQWVGSAGDADAEKAAEANEAMMSLGDNVIKVNLWDTWVGKYFVTSPGAGNAAMDPGGIKSAGSKLPYEYPYTVNYVKLGTGEFVPLSVFAALPADRQALMYKVGLDPKQALAAVRGEVLAALNVDVVTGVENHPNGDSIAYVQKKYDMVINGDRNTLGILIRQKVLPIIQQAYPKLSKSGLEGMLDKETDYMANMVYDMYKPNSTYSESVKATLKSSAYNKSLQDALSKNVFGYFDVAKMLPSASVSSNQYGTVADNLVSLLSTFEQQAKDKEISKLGNTVQQIRAAAKEGGEYTTLNAEELANTLKAAGISENTYASWFTDAVTEKNPEKGRENGEGTAITPIGKAGLMDYNFGGPMISVVGNRGMGNIVPRYTSAPNRQSGGSFPNAGNIRL